MPSSARAIARRDLVIIGARCAGATLAALMARAGARVLLVDKSPLPSDVVLSSHTLHPAGARVLAELGLAERLRAVTPPITTVRIGRGHGTLDLELPPNDCEWCPRRERFDGLLQDAARDAGAEVRERTVARALLWRGPSVVGVRLESASGEREDVHADIVVGADGRDSWLARQVHAEMYNDYEADRGMYWSYWDAPRGYGTCPDYPVGMYVANRDGMIRVAFLTDHAQVLVGSLPDRRALPGFRADPLGALRAALQGDSMLASFTGAAPSAKVRGFLPPRYFMRRAVGPGWVLLGDAGVFKDYVTGDGMTEALLQARSLASALSSPERDLERWWRARDVAALPFYLFGKIQGQAGAATVLDALVLARSAENPRLRERFARSLAHDMSPLEVVRPSQILGWAARAALGGELRVLGELRRSGGVMREFRSVMAEAEARLVACSRP